MANDKKKRKLKKAPDQRVPFYFKLIPKRFQPRAKEYPPRTIYVNNAARNKVFKYLDNSISTTKYTPLTFLPKNLFEQFKRLANFWFLIVTLINLIPGVAPISPWASVIPLAFVLCVTAVKEAYEDIRRWKSDISVNRSPVTVLRQGVFIEQKWMEVSAGDIVKLTKNEAVPADIAVISTSLENGACFIETRAIDGETNLKVRTALNETLGFKTESELNNFDGVVECEGPNNKLYNFSGRITVPGSTTKLPLDVRNCVWRGSTIRNTDWVIGVVVYSGHETKLMQNATHTPFKRSSLEKIMNDAIFGIFLFVLSITAISGILSLIWTRVFGVDHWYLLIEGRDDWVDRVFIFLTFVILYNVMIPISLYVSMELIKVTYVLLINHDIEMYDPLSDRRALARTSNLAEQLGQIDYVFSDKTGTLTANTMDFMRCCVRGKVYGEVPDFVTPDTEVNLEKCTFEDPKFFEDLKKGDEQAHFCKEFFMLLAVCHTVLIETQEDGRRTYQASSPDEAALVVAAKRMGFEFWKRTSSSVIVKTESGEEEFEVLNINEFNSKRKRMSIAVRCPDGTVKLYVKGADSIIFHRLAGNQDELMASTDEYLKEFANEGLRTLVLAYKDLSPAEYDEWNAKYQEAAVALENRDDLLDDVAELIEKDLLLIGASAIEDKLQDGVPEAIHNMLQMGIKVWVLTGDKEETAINIGFSCNLLTEEMTRIVLNEAECPDRERTLHAMDDAIDKYGLDNPSEHDQFALVIDGHTLHSVFGDEELELRFLDVATVCKAVIVCRASPLQKALVVKLIRYNERAKCLAIGDGANDVPMIQSAQVGVGISGKEGMQAVMASDYAIAQFRFLQRLLLVHGRWDYRRICKLILYSFYKNMTFALTQFWFNLFAGFSGQTLYESWVIGLYNTMFTFLPIMFLSALDQDVSEEKLKEYPQLYELGRKNKEFNRRLLWSWLGLGMLHSVFIIFSVLFVYTVALRTDGQQDGMFAAGSTAFHCVFWVVNIVVHFEMNYLTWLHGLSFFLTVFGWYLFFGVYQLVPLFPNGIYYIAMKVWSTPAHWLLVPLVVVMCMLPYVIFKYLQRQYWPENYQIIQEQMKLKKFSAKARREFYAKRPKSIWSSQKHLRPEHQSTGYAFNQPEGTRDDLFAVLGKQIRSVNRPDVARADQGIQATQEGYYDEEPGIIHR